MTILTPALPAQPPSADPVADPLASTALVDGELFDAAFADMRAEGTIQTSFPPPAPPPDPPPEWLTRMVDALGRFFEQSGPALQIALWVIGAALLLFILYRAFPSVRDRIDAWRQRGAAPIDDNAPDPGQARALLAEADALAAAGDYAGAAHLILYRSLEDIAERRPGLLRPALTARAIEGAAALPDVARRAFGQIARTVEISLFGGRPVDADGWQSCRRAYEDFAFRQNWAGPRAAGQ